ncbi:MAG: selenocysteine-specific translation elongation factor [Alphaproteobacteria bacterium]
MIVATAGHVDHGKTCLIRTLTGTDTDRLNVEKQRGLSIELGFAYWSAGDGRRFGFIDVPGHARFLPAMVAGIGGIDAAVLVVAADDGVMPQTREHLAVLDFLGVTQGVVALTKYDATDKDTVDRIAGDIEELLADTGLSGSPIVPVDSVSGTGFDNLQKALTALQPIARQKDAPARLAIDRAFLLKGVGLVATGTLLSGRFSVGDTVTVTPSGQAARIRGLHAQNEQVDGANAGQRCAVNLTGPGIDTESVKRGCWLVGNGGDSVTSRFDATIRLAPDATAIKRRDLPVYLHIGAAKTPARLVPLDRTGLPPGETALAQVVTDESVDVVWNDRFLLRNHAGTRTIAGGRVLTPFGATRGRTKPAHLNRLGLREREDSAAVIQALLKTPPYHVDLHEFGIERNLPKASIGDLANTTDATRFIANSRLHLANTAFWKTTEDRILETLTDCHEQEPHRPGLPEKGLLKHLGPDAPDAVLYKALLEKLTDDRRIVSVGGMIRLPSFSATLSQEDDALWLPAKAILETAGTQAPTLHEMAKKMEAPADLLAATLNRAAALGLIVHVSKNRYLLPETLAVFQSVIPALASEQPCGFAVTDFRDRVGIGRNLAIDLLEYMDRQGITRRDGNIRTAGASEE